MDDYKNIWKKYFDLDRDYGKIKRDLAEKDAVIKKAIAFGEGIRILNQEPWETVVSFIISANNNIPRIKKNIENLAKMFGEVAGEYKSKTYFNLPTPEKLSSLTEEDLKPIKLGYRASYLIKTAKQIQEEKCISYDRLRTYCGVGPKVANCISLFSLGHIESFPIDTWVKKVMAELYGIVDEKEMISFAKETFGELGGIAQQYLFYYMRSKV